MQSNFTQLDPLSPLSRIKRVIDQEFRVEKLLRAKDITDLTQLEEKVAFLIEETQRPYVSPISAIEPSPILSRKDSIPVIFQDTMGQYIKLTCKVCSRSNFNSPQALIAHSQTSHNISLGTPKEAIMECGSILDYHEIPEDTDLKNLNYAVSTSPNQSIPESRVQSPPQAEDGRMKRGAIELPKVKLNTINPPDPTFYIKRSVIIGNINQFIAPENRITNYEKCAYRWMLFVRTKFAIDITTFVAKVRFYFHNSYKPHEVVDVTSPPFYVTRLGWGEFISRIQIFFHDSRNSPIDIPYHLKLDQQCIGKEVLGDEKFYELNLRKDTRFEPPRNFPGHDKFVPNFLESPIDSSLVEEARSPATKSQSQPRIEKIPSISNCKFCGSESPHEVPRNLFVSENNNVEDLEKNLLSDFSLVNRPNFNHLVALDTPSSNQIEAVKEFSQTVTRWTDKLLDESSLYVLTQVFIYLFRLLNFS
eukprot:NODE_292_length_10587_cov_0.520881.p3 type:complete len:475 gc:universal NODE_292_length_10587_cov_0.520881:8344-9768(+)